MKRASISSDAKEPDKGSQKYCIVLGSAVLCGSKAESGLKEREAPQSTAGAMQMRGKREGRGGDDTNEARKAMVRQGRRLFRLNVLLV